MKNILFALAILGLLFAIVLWWSEARADTFDEVIIQQGLTSGHLVGSDSTHKLVDATPQPSSTPPNTPVPTATAINTPTPRATDTPPPTPVATATAVSTPTPRATDTPIPPVATATPFATPTPQAYAVLSLPTCNAGSKYLRVFVSDATVCVFNVAPSTGGSTACPVFCDGSTWLGG